jgi:hypothetical protein
MSGLNSISRVGLAWVLASAFSAGTASAQQQSASAGPASAAAERAVLVKYCVGCHSDKAKTGGLTLEKRDLGNVSATPTFGRKW